MPVSSLNEDSVAKPLKTAKKEQKIFLQIDKEKDRTAMMKYLDYLDVHPKESSKGITIKKMPSKPEFKFSDEPSFDNTKAFDKVGKIDYEELIKSLY